jgi:hypothetical protein
MPKKGLREARKDNGRNDQAWIFGALVYALIAAAEGSATRTRSCREGIAQNPTLELIEGGKAPFRC